MTCVNNVLSVQRRREEASYFRLVQCSFIWDVGMQPSHFVTMVHPRLFEVARYYPLVESGLIVLVTTAQSGHGPFCSLVVLDRSFTGGCEFLKGWKRPIHICILETAENRWPIIKNIIFCDAAKFSFPGPSKPASSHFPCLALYLLTSVRIAWPEAGVPQRWISSSSSTMAIFITASKRGQISGDKCLSPTLFTSLCTVYSVDIAPQRPHTDPDLLLPNWDVSVADSGLAPFCLPDLDFQVRASFLKDYESLFLSGIG